MADHDVDHDRDELPPPDPKRARKLSSVQKLNFRSWLWLQHHEGTEFAALARLVLGGGPENVWANKPLKASSVEFDIAQMFASGRGGISESMYELAGKAVEAYRDDDRSVSDLIEEQKKVEVEATRAVGLELGAAMEPEQIDGLMVLRERSFVKPDGTLTAYPQFGQGGIVRVSCDFTFSSGRKCSRTATIGCTRCDHHGGTYLTPDEIRETLQNGQERLVDASAKAIDVLIDVMENSVRDEVKLKAVEMLLDRTGFRAGVDINHRSGENVQKSAVDALQERLDKLVPTHMVVDQQGNELGEVAG